MSDESPHAAMDELVAEAQKLGMYDESLRKDDEMYELALAIAAEKPPLLLVALVVRLGIDGATAIRYIEKMKQDDYIRVHRLRLEMLEAFMVLSVGMGNNADDIRERGERLERSIVAWHEAGRPW